MGIDFGSILTKAKEVAKGNSGTKREKDERFITVTKDETGSGSIVVRFLPDKNSLPAIIKYSHFGTIEGDDGKKRYFVGECPTTKDEPCPYCEKYLAAWKYKDEETKEFLKSGKRKEEYIANVLVVKDPGNPENVGKVMLFRYTYKVNQLIESAINGDDEVGIAPINIYDPFAGANFLLKHTKQGEYFSLDGSMFLPSSKVVDSEEEFMEMWDKTYDLEAFKQELEYMTYEELSKKLFYYENGVYPDEESNTPDSEPTPEPEKKAAPKKEPAKKSPKKETPKPDSANQESLPEDDDDFFSDL